MITSIRDHSQKKWLTVALRCAKEAYFRGKADHQLVSETLATLGNSQALNEQRNSSQPFYGGKPFSHWINITKTERSTTILCYALRAGAELAKTAEDKAALLEVTRTLARKHGAAGSGGHYNQALSKAISVLDPTDIIQFVLDELEHETSQSVKFCWSLFNYLEHDNAFAEQAPKLLQLIVSQFEEGGAGASSRTSLLYKFISTLIGNRGWSTSFAVGGLRAYKSGFLEKRVSWANEKNPTLAPTIRQFFLDSSA